MSVDILGPTWNLTPNGVELITEGNSLKDTKKILQNALDTDLKEIGAAVLAKLQGKNATGEIVLQIQKIRNIAAPKANEKSQAAPRMLKLVLTDGDSYLQAIELTPLTSISPEKVSPGTKILLKNAKISSGYALLTQQNCTLLGGKVQALYEKWELAKSITAYNRQAHAIDGAPAWVNFGGKLTNTPNVDDAQFQSLVSKEAKENSEFELQRKGAIAEATSGAVKKVFGGGAKQTVQSNTNNQNYRKNTASQREPRERRGTKLDPEDVAPLKPTEKVSLFAFLEDKIPEIPPQEVATNRNPPQNQYNRNYSGQNADYNRYKGGNTYQSGRNYNDFNRSAQSKPPSHNKNYNPHNKYENSRRNDNEPVKRNDSETTKKNDVENLTNRMDKVSLNKQFASRSLKQHLDLDKKREVHTEWKWKVGDECLAKYWEDAKYYDACITAVTEKTCVVKFRGYDNIEEVLKAHCLPVEKDPEPPRNEQRRYNNARVFSRRQ